MSYDYTKVLDSVKKSIGAYDGDTAFDFDILLGINVAVSVLEQLGCEFGTYEVTSSTTWTALFTPSGGTIMDQQLQNLVKQYLYFKTRKQFDPAQTSTVRDANEDMIKELEERISYYVDDEYEA